MWLRIKLFRNPLSARNCNAYSNIGIKCRAKQSNHMMYFVYHEACGAVVVTYPSTTASAWLGVRPLLASLQLWCMHETSIFIYLESSNAQNNRIKGDFILFYFMSDAERSFFLRHSFVADRTCNLGGCWPEVLRWPEQVTYLCIGALLTSRCHRLSNLT